MPSEIRLPFVRRIQLVRAARVLVTLGMLLLVAAIFIPGTFRIWFGMPGVMAFALLPVWTVLIVVGLAVLTDLDNKIQDRLRAHRQLMPAKVRKR